ncbi:hypothetical protein [Lunatimonas salinarum]|uniref:hypothetical protein n=1 Tax=Lunatimonas salinarum TaxID=1774590 RepID=UPI001FD802A2|nr:hypothetical protein [Lunatimonas salinarum]
MMVDPDGELAWFVPIIIGAVVGGTSQGIASANNGGSFFNGFWKGALIGAAAGTAAIGVTAGLAGASFTGIASGTVSAGFGATVAGGVAGGLTSGGLSTAFYGGSLGQNLLNGAIGGAVGGLVPSIGGTGVLPGAGLGALGGGVAGGITAELTGGNFGDGFKQGALSGAISGGIYGGIAASQSQFDRSLLFGTLTRSGRHQAFSHYAEQYNLQANGAKNIKFADLADAYGTTVPLDPNTGQPISLARAAISYPQGVDSEVTFGLGRLMSLKKIRANVLHEGQHVIDLKAGKATHFRNAAKTNMGFIGRFEISAHRAVYNLGIQRAYNLSRITYWQQFP